MEQWNHKYIDYNCGSLTLLKETSDIHLKDFVFSAFSLSFSDVVDTEIRHIKQEMKDIRDINIIVQGSLCDVQGSQVVSRDICCIFFITCVNVSYSVIKLVVLEMNMSYVVSILTEKQFPTVSSGPHR